MATLEMSPAPRVLAHTTLFRAQAGPAQADVSPDGDRFLLIEPVSSTTNPARIHVVSNWLDELVRELPQS